MQPIQTASVVVPWVTANGFFAEKTSDESDDPKGISMRVRPETPNLMGS